LESESTDQPAFQVASIKVSDSPTEAIGGYYRIRPGGTVSMWNVTLNLLIYIAYGVEAYRVSGGPGWVAILRYNVDAQPAARVEDSEAQLMFQTLPAERFHLQVPS